MKHIKRGRGPSFLQGISSVGGALFGVFWTMMALAMGAWFVAPFGLVFIGIAVANAIYNFKNAKGKERYSEYDIVDGHEEPDPWDRRYGTEIRDAIPGGEANRFCPYCGRAVEGDFEFCPGCGRKLPE